MPRYHFNVYDGITILDPIGTEFDTWDDARADAIRSAGETLTDEAKRIALGENWRMEVTDDRGHVLFCLVVSVKETPALMKSAAINSRQD